jgi:hypothetical protein
MLLQHIDTAAIMPPEQNDSEAYYLSKCHYNKMLKFQNVTVEKCHSSHCYLSPDVFGRIHRQESGSRRQEG